MLKLQLFAHLCELKSEFVLAAYSQDPAGVTMIDYLKSKAGFADEGSNAIGESLKSPRYGNVRLCVSEGSLLHLENLDKVYSDASSFVFLSKHRSDSKIPTLTCHCTGNFSDNPYGGNPKEIAIAYPSLQKAYLKAITDARHRVPDYDIVIEATHHGPTSLAKPVLFVELGSSEGQWADKNAGAFMCECLLGVLGNGVEPCCGKVGVALGGTHYPTKFNKLLLESEFGLAAVASKHNLEAIDEQMLGQMVDKSAEKVTHVVLDGKGLGSQKDRIVRLAEKTGLEVYKI